VGRNHSGPPSGQKLSACRIWAGSVLAQPSSRLNPAYIRPPNVGTKTNEPPLLIFCSLTAPASGQPPQPPLLIAFAPLAVTLTVAVQATGPGGLAPPVDSAWMVTVT
jgi:hypothetical protein